jgi:Fic family protein
MHSFIDIERTFGDQPPRLGAVLARIDVGRGREDLYRDQVPELLRSLASQTRVESISASSAIEGVVVDPDRLGKLLDPGRPVRFRDRNEQEFAGYRDAVEAIFRTETAERMSVPLILNIHRDLFRHTEARGGYLKTDDNRIVTRDESGMRVLLFEPPPWQQTEFLLTELVARYNDALDLQVAHPILLIGAFVLDFLAIHPLTDGNGRVGRILTTQTLLQRGYGVPRYVSIEQRIYHTKNTYYDVLFQSQRNWHEAKHTAWPWLSYLADVLADAYDTFEERVAAERLSHVRMTKQERVRVHVLHFAPPSFTIDTLRRSLPGISDQTIRLVLGAMRREGLLDSDDNGRNALWTRLELTHSQANQDSEPAFETHQEWLIPPS